MNELGYTVDWEDNKKYITFTNPNGQKCRNRKMYPKYLFTKENLQKQFQDNSTTYSPEELKKIQKQFIDRVKSVEHNTHTCIFNSEGMKALWHHRQKKP